MKEFLKKNGITAGIVLIVAVVIFFAGFNAGKNSQPDINKTIGVLSGQESGMPQTTDFSPFWKAWNILNEKYVANSATSSPTDQEKIWGAISGLANSYGDPYTVFFPPEESKTFASDIAGNFEGVGMEIGQKDGVLTVIAPLKNTPAYNAGIMAGDKILKIDNKSTAGVNPDEAVKLIRGPKGSKVVLTISRKDKKESFEISIVRAVINIPTIDTESRQDGIFVIRLYNFSAISADQFRGALREFVESNKQKLILDLRGNPGGYLEASIDMASWFLPAGDVVVKESTGKENGDIVFRSKGYDIFNDKLQMVILIDNGSASASEILAGALSEHKIATLIGTKTYGKGSVQELVKLTPDTSIKITIARWFTPNGISISEDGLNPDILVERTADDFAKGVDPQMNKAIDFLLKK